jgi:hypothetical protein
LAAPAKSDFRKAMIPYVSVSVDINQRLLWGLISEKLGTLTKRLAHPTVPVLLTKNGPLGAQYYSQNLTIGKEESWGSVLKAK